VFSKQMSVDKEEKKKTTTRKSNPIPAVMRISREKAAKLLEARKKRAFLKEYDDPLLACLIDTGLHQNGYPTCSWDHVEANIQVSHLVLRVEKGDNEVPYRSRRETASHLCHNKSCIRADHIIKEAIGLNSRRNGCLAFVEAPCCKVRVNACGHEPHCLLPFPRPSSSSQTSKQT
jgi:hypothetical protein